MLDKRTGILLEQIDALCGGGGYKIVEEGELLSRLPEGVYGGPEEVRHALRYLEESRCLDIRYEEDGVYCLCPLPAGRLYLEQLHSARADKVRRRGELLLFTFLGSLLGTWVGGLIVWLVSFAAGGA